MPSKNHVFGRLIVSPLFFLFAAPALNAGQTGPVMDRGISPGFGMDTIAAVEVKAPARPKPGTAATSSCASSRVFNFGGAYFRKLSGVPGKNAIGILAEGVLPGAEFDPGRFFVSQDGQDYKTGPLDRPSVYMGAGSDSNELDCGLSWDRVYTPSGLAAWTDSPDLSDGGNAAKRFAVSSGGQTLYDGLGAEIAKGTAAVTVKIAELKLRPDFAFRPFWRTTGMPGGAWHNPPKDSPENAYFYRGDKIKMAVRYLGGSKFIMEISAPGRNFSVPFEQKGFSGVKRAFKRINSIDQFRVVNGVRKGNEGLPVIPTKTRVTGAIWTNTYILETAKTGPVLAPFTGKNCAEHRGKDTAGRYSGIFKISDWNDQGGETLDILP